MASRSPIVTPRPAKLQQQVYDDLPLEFLRKGGDVHATKPGYAIGALNMISQPGMLSSRWGTTSLQTFGATPVSIKEFIAQDASTRRLIVLLNNGTLSYETGTYTFSTILTNVVEATAAASLRMNSQTAFGREYMAFSTNGQTPAQVPSAWDGTDFRRVAPEGPGQPPLIVAGAGGGTTSAGIHKVRVLFLTKWGFLTPPSDAATITITAGTKFDLSGIPIGPTSYVVGRWIAMTAADDEDYYTIEGSPMVIEDNTTTTLVGLDFSDSTLLAGTPISVQGEPDSDQATLINLPPQVSCFKYKERLCWVGGRANLVRNGDQGPYAMGFDGGFSAGLPMGWSSKDPGYSKGAGSQGQYGDYLIFTCDGASQTGCIENRTPNLAWIPPGVDIRYRIRVRKNAALSAGTLHLVAVTATGAAATSTVEPVVTGTGPTSTTVSASEVSSSEWRIIDRLWLAAANNTKTELWRLRLAVGGGGLGTVGTNTGEWWIDYIEMYVASKEYDPALGRWSRVSKPDAYDGLTGYQYVNQDDGQRTLSGFVLGDTAYYVKETSLHATRDDGSREPAFWGTSVVSDIVGSPSAKGVGKGDQWVAIAGKNGLYYFDGGEPIPLSECAESYWSAINWTYGYQLECKVDMERKTIHVLIPTGTSGPLTIFSFQWFGTKPSPENIRFTRNNILVSGSGVALHAMEASLRPDGSTHFLFACASGNRLIRIDDTARSDFGNLINWLYKTPWFGDYSGAKRFVKMRAYMYGQGTISIIVRRPSGYADVPSPITYTLADSPAPHRDINFPELRYAPPRLWLEFGTVGQQATDYIVIHFLSLYWEDALDEGSVTRGM